MNERSTRLRFVSAGLILSLAMTGLGFRLVYLHSGRVSREPGRREFRTELPAPRGRIFDRNGHRNMMALDVAVKDVCADPSLVTQTGQAAELAEWLAPLLAMPEDVLAMRLNRPDRAFAYLKRYVPEPVADAIAAERRAGIFFRDSTIRRYPHGASMGHVLGFVNYERMGSAGVEQFHERYLRGAPGFMEGALNAKRQELYERRGQVIHPVVGADIHLTLDQNIQYVAEQALEAAVARYQAKGGVVVVQHVRTGEILAMASWPFFDPNTFTESTPEQRRNLAVAYNYEPGSTFKPMIVAAALDEQLATAETMIDCEQGAWHYMNRVLRDVRPYGLLSLADVVQKSSNIGTAKLGVQLGDERLYRYLRAFGFGERTGIDLPGEERGILHPVNRWSRLDSSRISIGQAVAVTPVQLLSALCAIANDGVLMRPHVVREIRRSDGRVVYQSRPQALGQPVSPEAARSVSRMLQRVTEEGGTGRRARLDGYTVAGKTGTAQKVVDGHYSKTAYVASFAGYLPADDPEIGILVVIDEPRPEIYGGVVAAPVFHDIAKETVLYLDVLPQHYRVAQRY